MKLVIKESRIVPRIIFNESIDKLNIREGVISFVTDSRVMISSGMVVDIISDAEILKNREILSCSCIPEGSRLTVRLHHAPCQTIVG
ncbi:MAG: hypothetical protein ACRCX2_02965 [Paraclostridium sp.]